MRQTRCTWSSGFSLYPPREACVRWAVRLGMEYVICFCGASLFLLCASSTLRALKHRHAFCPGQGALCTAQKSVQEDTGGYANAISAIGPVFLDPWRGLNLR